MSACYRRYAPYLLPLRVADMSFLCGTNKSQNDQEGNRIAFRANKSVLNAFRVPVIYSTGNQDNKRYVLRVY